MVSESNSKLFLKKEILDQPMKRLNRIREEKYFPPNLFLTEAEMDTEKDIKTLEREWKESVSKRFEVVPEENIEEIGQASQGEVSKVQIVNSLSQDKRFQNEGNWINLTVFLKCQPTSAVYQKNKVTEAFSAFLAIQKSRGLLAKFLLCCV